MNIVWPVMNKMFVDMKLDMFSFRLAILNPFFKRLSRRAGVAEVKSATKPGFKLSTILKYAVSLLVKYSSVYWVIGKPEQVHYRSILTILQAGTPMGPYSRCYHYVHRPDHVDSRMGCD